MSACILRLKVHVQARLSASLSLVGGEWSLVIASSMTCTTVYNLPSHNSKCQILTLSICMQAQPNASLSLVGRDWGLVSASSTACLTVCDPEPP